MCELSKELVALLDGELSVDEAPKLERHLEICDECRGRAEQYLRASLAFEAYCDTYCQALTASKQRFELAHWLPAISAATVMAAVFAAILLFAPRAREPRLALRPPAPPVHTALNSLSGQIPEAEAAMKPEPGEAARLPIRRQHLPRFDRARSASGFNRSTEERQTPGSFAQIRSEEANSLFGAAAIQVAIPADALFPPGAVPPGISFTADIAIGPDASVQRISLRPRLHDLKGE